MKNTVSYAAKLGRKAFLVMAMATTACTPTFGGILNDNAPTDQAQIFQRTDAPNVANDTLSREQIQTGFTEKFALTSLNITYAAGGSGNINFNFTSRSQRDPDREDGKPYASTSGDLTTMSMHVVDNDMNGVIDNRIADARAEFLEIEFLNPGLNNLANVKIIFTTNTRTSDLPLYFVNGSDMSENPIMPVHQLELTGTNIPVTLNGDVYGNNQRLAKGIINNTKNVGDNFGKRSFKILEQYNHNGEQISPMRKVTPEGGSTQLRPLRETVTLNNTLQRRQPAQRNLQNPPRQYNRQ